ncbi:FAD:protein FMN transferase [Nocardioides iriomotensis]|uniref:FAD:protein FMN transferase n=1 Tax=Nocardioides iriomotensis TaxID=715784 RepID=A0A4Q5J606_9ACTN|nr:FAD:protein FMN transferase [Nocardioides iriomotensis]RYU12985.1 FAD:protein FMN transferase [Nocardioides iriomotensis]
MNENRYVEQVMGLPVTLVLRGRHAGTDAGAAAWSEVLACLRYVDTTFSTYRPGSAVSRIDRGELTVDDAPAVVREVVELAERAHELTDGWFSVWLPDADRPGRRRFDPSGLVKGWAVERAATALDRLDGTDWCLAAGGDLVARTGRTHDGRVPWRVGVEDPADPRRTLAVVPLLDGGCATSGDAHRGAHVLDPWTGRPARAGGSVTVVAPTLLWADVWATAGYARGDAAADWLAATCPYTTLVVGPGGDVRMTDARDRDRTVTSVAHA